MPDLVWWCIAIGLGLLAAFCVTGNLVIVLRYVIVRRRGSMVPLVGGISGTLALLAVPAPGWAQYWWIPLVLDPGCVPMLGILVVMWTTGRLR